MSIFSITPRSDSGKVYIEEQTISWKVNQEVVLNIPISEIRILGEYTTVHALHTNEWFMVFVLKNDEMVQISMYAQGMDEVLKSLSRILDAGILTRLAEEREYKSNVIWPINWAGQELYDLKVIKPKTFFDRFRARLGFGSQIELVLREGLTKI